MRAWIGTQLIRLGFFILPKDLNALIRGILLYHVPGVLSEGEKAEIRAAKQIWKRKLQQL